MFYVETDPTYAEATVDITSTQLLSSCLGGVTWTSNLGPSTGATAAATIDNDGNAVFAFTGSSMCGHHVDGDRQRPGRNPSDLHHHLYGPSTGGHLIRHCRRPGQACRRRDQLVWARLTGWSSP